MSELLIKPLTVTSVRKLPEFATVPLCALVWLMSELLTARLALVSPSNTPICTGPKLPAVVLSAIAMARRDRSYPLPQNILLCTRRYNHLSDQRSGRSNHPTVRLVVCKKRRSQSQYPQTSALRPATFGPAGRRRAAPHTQWRGNSPLTKYCNLQQCRRTHPWQYCPSSDGACPLARRCQFGR